jgi:hypothetical protein
MNLFAHRNRSSLVALVLFIILNLWLRYPAGQTEGFHNEDVAGIAYSAQLLHSGGLPLIDTLELKAPGSFFLTAIVWSFCPMTIESMQWVGIFWSCLALLGIFIGSLKLFGPQASILSTALYLVLAPIVDSIDVNYGAWMIAPYIWSFVCFVSFMKSRKFRWLIAAGALLAMAGLLKRQGAVLTPLFGVALFVIARQEHDGIKATIVETLRLLIPLLLGLALGFLPIFVFYAAHGALGEFAHHYFFSPGGWSYLDTLSWTEKKVRLSDGVLGFLEYGACATVLAGISLISRILQQFAQIRQHAQRETESWLLVIGLLAVSVLGLSLGFRFFKGYYLQTLPALVWIAGASAGALGLVFDRTTRLKKLMAAGIVVMVCAPFIKTDFKALKSIRHQRHTARDLGAQKIAADIKSNTQASDRIWVWGRAAWPIYVHANRLAATRYPKTLAVFTTNLTNTWRRGTKPTTFEPRSDWRTLIQQLKQDKPAYVVLAHNERYSKFSALHKLLRTHYRRSPSPTRGFSVYRIRK